MPQEPSDSNRCLVCGTDNPVGLHMVWRQTEEGVEATVQVAGHFAGFQDVVHGGIVTAMLDDGMWHAIHRRFGWSPYTVDLSTRFRRPVPTDTPLVVRARCLDLSHRVARAEATLSVLGQEGKRPWAEAVGRFMQASAKV